MPHPCAPTPAVVYSAGVVPLPATPDLRRPVGRELAPDEFGKLAPLPLGQSLLSPEGSAVAVVEVAGRIIATWAALTTIHAEGCWIEPEYRGNPAVTQALVTAFYQLLAARGIPAVLTVTQTPDTDALAVKLGAQPIHGQLWLLPVGGA